MCLYWPEHHLAINIIDDPYSPDFEQDQDPATTVLSISTKQLNDQETMYELAQKISAHMGFNLEVDTHDPAWRARNKRLLDELVCGIF